jgi:hypothetical protein
MSIQPEPAVAASKDAQSRALGFGPFNWITSAGVGAHRPPPDRWSHAFHGHAQNHTDFFLDAEEPESLANRSSRYIHGVGLTRLYLSRRICGSQADTIASYSRQDSSRASAWTVGGGSIPRIDVAHITRERRKGLVIFCCNRPTSGWGNMKSYPCSFDLAASDVSLAVRRAQGERARPFPTT